MTYPPLTITGQPRTEGSLQPRQTRDHVCPLCQKAHGRMYATHDQDRELRLWRQLIKRGAEELWRRPGLAEPCFVMADFVVPKPSVHYHEKDVDKLLRAVLDALAMAGVFADDKHVALALGVKHYAGAAHPYPGATIMFGTMKDATDALARLYNRVIAIPIQDHAGRAPPATKKATARPRPRRLRLALTRRAPA